MIFFSGKISRYITSAFTRNRKDIGILFTSWFDTTGNVSSSRQKSPTGIHYRSKQKEHFCSARTNLIWTDSTTDLVAMFTALKYASCCFVISNLRYVYMVFHHKTRDQRWLSRIKYEEEALKTRRFVPQW